MTALLIVLALLTGAAGCNSGDDAVSDSVPDVIARDLWPRCDGGAWHNVMEAGFLSAEAASEPQPVAAGPAVAEGDSGNAVPVPLLYVHPGKSMPVVGFKERSGFWRLLQADAYSNSGPHIALRHSYRSGEPALGPGLFPDPEIQTHIIFGILQNNCGVKEERSRDLHLDQYWVVF